MNKHLQPPGAEDIQMALGLTPAARRNSRVKRGLWLALVALVVAGAALAWWRGSGDQPTTRYETEPARIADLTLTVSATGTIEPITKVDVGSELSGIVADVIAKENDLVTSGQVLARLDVTRLRAQHQSAVAKVRIAEAGVAVAEATAAERKLNLDRQKKLGISGVTPKEQVDLAIAESARAVASVDSARGQLAAAEADLAVIESDLSNADIVSPIDGIVLKRTVEPGQTVAASLQAPVLFQIAQDLRRIQLEAQVDEADIGMVREGQQASFTVDAYRARSFPAVIEKLSFAPEEVDGVITYKAILSAPNDDLALRPGMTATARIVVEEFKQALTVPNEALRYEPPREEASSNFSVTQIFMPRFPRANRGKREEAADGTRSLYVLRAGAPVEVRVKAGASDGKRTIVSGEIKAEDPVIIAQQAAGP